MRTEQEKLIQDLLKERDELLRKHPELLKVQLEIEASLAEIDDPVQRAQILFQKLLLKLKEEFIPAQKKLAEIKTEYFDKVA